jgi:hypothetical protein
MNTFDGKPLYYLDIEADYNDESEVDFVALVDKPAIQKNFLKFEDTYTDYPESVKNTAQKALDWAEENGWGECGTQVGKTRANQLANGEPISVETIKRMYSYLSRHKVDLQSSKTYEDGCGLLMYDAWGGEAALNWAEKKLTNIEKMKFAIQNEEERIVSGPLMLADTPIYRFDKHGEYYVVFNADSIKKIVQKYFKKGYQSNVNLMHDPTRQVEGVTLFESFITSKKRGIQPMQGFEDAPEGSWFGSFKIENDEVWDMVKKGDFKGFSVEGMFNYKRPEEMNVASLISKDQQIMNDIMEWLKQIEL